MICTSVVTFSPLWCSHFLFLNRKVLIIHNPACWTVCIFMDILILKVTFLFVVLGRCHIYISINMHLCWVQSVCEDKKSRGVLLITGIFKEIKYWLYVNNTHYNIVVFYLYPASASSRLVTDSTSIDLYFDFN